MLISILDTYYLHAELSIGLPISVIITLFSRAAQRATRSGSLNSLLVTMGYLFAFSVPLVSMAMKLLGKGIKEQKPDKQIVKYS